MQDLPMWTRQHRQRRSGRFIIPVMTAAVLSYFGYHAYHGAYGMNSKEELDGRIASLQTKLKHVTDERAALERRVSMLRDGTIEKDMLDEYARRELDYVRPDELVIILPQGE